MDSDSITRVSVLGLGTMGHGIAQTMAMAGCQVCGYDAATEARAGLHNRVQANLQQMLAVGLVEENAIAAALERITVCDSEADALTDAQFVTEAVAEDLALKQELFRRIEDSVDSATILASNTSSYPMTEVSVNMQHPERAVVTHWFNPPHVIPVVEVVPGEKTSDATAQTAYEFLNRIGKTAIRINQELPGFLVNRVQVAMFREVLDLLDRNVASPEDIDRAIRGSAGLRLAALGPLAIIDYAGLDITSRVYENLAPDLRSDAELPNCIAKTVAAGNLGAKTGQGIFAHPAEQREQAIAARDRLYLELVKLTGNASN